jgi:hypothetical protein
VPGLGNPVVPGLGKPLVDGLGKTAAMVMDKLVEL